MRLIDFGEPELYQPLERGSAFPQFYENGDRYVWENPWAWSWTFWYFLHWHCRYHPDIANDEAAMLLMGGEL